MGDMLWQRGPQTRPRATYNKTGIGQVKQLRGNPITWNFDCQGRCFPSLTLRGSQDQTSQALRTATAQNLKPRQTVLQSRGVLGVIERADGAGGLPQGYNQGTAQTPVSDPVAAPTSGGSSAPSSPCGDGLVYVPLAGGNYKCAAPWGN